MNNAPYQDHVKGETVKIKLWRESSTAKAHLFHTLPGDKSNRKLWIPRSVISHLSTLPKNQNETLTPCLVDIESWFAEKEDLG